MKNYEQWVEQIPSDIKKDSVWSLKVYRASLYASDLCWKDTNAIQKERLFSLSDQLYKSVCSISSNVCEGYSRRSPKEQARFYEIALGSARESKDWYFKSRYILGEEKTLHRIKLLTAISKLLLTMINERRNTSRKQDKKDIS